VQKLYTSGPKIVFIQSHQLNARKMRIVAVYCFISTSLVQGFVPLPHTAKTFGKEAFPTTVTSLAAEENNPFAFITSLLPKQEEKVIIKEEKPKIPDAVCDPDFKLGAVVLAVAPFVLGLSTIVEGGSPSLFGVLVSLVHGLFGALFLVQATRIRFVFDETCFELKNRGVDDDLISSGSNVVVGGENRWTYDSFVNYEFFGPSQLPILVYFKETQTPEEQWSVGPGQFDKNNNGQVHFFPVIANPGQLKAQFELRGCAKIEA